MENADLSPIQTLKAATRQAHEQLERIVFAGGDPASGLSLARYTGMLRANYRLHAALEPGVSAALDRHLPELAYGAERRKLPALIADLAALHQALPAVGVLPEPDLAQALGAAYVLEGATLGGQLILRALRADSALASSGALDYYGLYGADVGPRWKQFGTCLNRSLSSPMDLERACQAARDAFVLASEVFADEAGPSQGT